MRARVHIIELRVLFSELALINIWKKIKVTDKKAQVIILLSKVELYDLN
jgi:hypothetical protein